jgi:predicted ATPase
LDEPEAALSPLRQLTLLVEINRLVHDNSQFIVATHSPIPLAFPDATQARLCVIARNNRKSRKFCLKSCLFGSIICL